MMTCNLCGEKIESFGMSLDHLRDVHGIDEEIERWPDGEIVIHDTTLEPGDFGGGA